MVAPRTECLIVQATRASLREIGTGSSPRTIASDLVAVGDALRMGLGIPQKVRARLAALSMSDLDRVLGGLVDDSRASLDSPCDARLVRTRDELESMLSACLRVALDQQFPLTVIPHAVCAMDLIAVVDDQLRGRVTRPQADEHLAERAALQPLTGWTSALPEIPIQRTFGASSSRLTSRTPSSDVALDYVTHAAAARYVEKQAAYSPEFGSFLADLIDGCCVACEQVSLAARRWRDVFRGVFGPIRLELVPRPEPLQHVRRRSGGRVAASLGWLVPVHARARLSCARRTASFRLVGDPARVLRVELGGAVVPNRGSVWSIAVPIPKQSIHLFVAEQTGERFFASIQLEPVRHSIREPPEVWRPQNRA